MAMTQMDQPPLDSNRRRKGYIKKLGKSYETRKATMALDSQFRTYAIKRQDSTKRRSGLR